MKKKINDLHIDLKQLKMDREANFRERLNFVKFWTDHIKGHLDEEWGEQQNVVIDSQIN